MEKKDLSKIKWGEIYTCDLGKMKGSVQCGVRPVLVVQTNKLNGSSPTVVVAVITSVRKREDIASHIPLETDCGLNEPSMVMLEQIRTIDKAEELISYVGRIEDGETIAKIKDGIVCIHQDDVIFSHVSFSLHWLSVDVSVSGSLSFSVFSDTEVSEEDSSDVSLLVPVSNTLHFR